MKTIYYYIFYRIYSLWKKMPGMDFAFSAMAALSLLLGLNIVTLMVIIKPYYSISLKTGKILIIIFALFLFVSNYFIFVYKERFKKIEEKFKDESNNQKIKRAFGIILYVILTFVLLFGALFI